MASRPLKLGICLWPQYSDWPSLRSIAIEIDRLGFDSLWTWDHLYPVYAAPDGPIFEGYLTLAAWGCLTHRVTLGLMVGANTFRHPALTAKMATTLDHISGGRAVLGIGGAWFEPEHRAYGIDFGSGFGERLDRLDEAVMIMRGMLDGSEPSGRSVYFSHSVVNHPLPIQAHLPILIGGGGETKTLATVARYADMWNIGGDVETARHKDDVLRRWCIEVGRDTDEIERTIYGGAVVIRRSDAAARSVVSKIQLANRGLEREPELVGTPDAVVERMVPFLSIGFRHMYFDLPAPYDQETLDLLANEVRPKLADRLADAANN